MNFLALLGQAGPPNPDPWSGIFFGLEPGHRFAVLIVTIGCVTGIICTVVGCVTSMLSSQERVRTEAELKRELIDRGMTAEEIAQVVEAAPPKDFLERWADAQGKRKRKC